MGDSTNIVFPTMGNLNFRNGWVKLTAYESEWEEAVADENFSTVLDRLTNTNRKKEPDFTGTPQAYLDNAVSNMKKDRSSQMGKVKFTCILPLPLLFLDSTAVEWSSTTSAFGDALFATINNGKLGNWSNTIAATAENRGRDKDGNMSRVGKWAQTGAGALASATSKSNNALTAYLVGNMDVTKAIHDAAYSQKMGKPGQNLSKLVAEASDVNMINAFKEAAAINGKRQVIFNPGYWQNFQGVKPRQFSLSWEIIPENHEDAVNGLALCSRIREHSLPQSVSGVELLSPCYWQLDWSADYLTAQTLYANLIITNITVKYAEDGEWHVSMTPKKFRIDITFEEAKAPTCDLYKANYDPIPQNVANTPDSSSQPAP